MIGKEILHYKILDKIGEGGMGVVYKAHDARLGRTVALKFMPPDLSRDADSKERFIKEAQAIAALDHPNLCTIHAIEEADDGRLFIAMACYDGQTLAKKIEPGPIPVEEAIDIAIAMAEGMKTAHDRGIVHRDIKPANVFMVKNGPVKVIDFGLAKWFGKTSLTRAGVALGTVAYMSPEQARGEEVDARADVWALGVVLYEMLTGRRPFGGDYDQAIVYRVLNEDPAPITSLRANLPSGVERIVTRALSKDPNGRYQSTGELLSELRAVRGTRHDEGQSDSHTGADPSIAVLPFVNMSPDPENEYFGDGLAEELINALARLGGIRVVARTSVFRFRDGGLDVRDIGRQLGVGTVLEGSVRKEGDTLRVTAQLIDAGNGYHIWSDRYERRMEDVFAIQDEITRAIVGELKVKLTGPPDSPLVKRYTDNLQAYNLFLKGRYYMLQLTPEGWKKSIQCYEEALRHDPSYAPVYVGIAVHHQSQTFWGDVPPSNSIPLAKAAVEKALELDESLADAHLYMASTLFTFDWDFEAAEKEFVRSLELDPRSALSRVNYALFLMIQKRFDEAAAEAALAMELDPLSALIQTWGAMIPGYAGRPAESIEILKQVLELDPNFWQPYYHIARAHLFASDPNQAVVQAKKAVELSGGPPIALECLALAYYHAGQKDDGDNILRRLEEKDSQGWVAASIFFWIHVARGDLNKAYYFLERAVQDHDPWLCFYGVIPREFRPDDPRFDRLVQSAGLMV